MPLRDIRLIVLDDIGNDRHPLSGDPGEKPQMEFLKALAAESAVFPELYVQPACSPTRASLLTGLQTFRTGVGEAYKETTDTYSMPTTLDTVLHAAVRRGYSTSVVGKWHLGWSPTDAYARGAQRAQVTVGNSGDFYSWEAWVDGVQQQIVGYSTEVLTDWAVLEEQRLGGGAGARPPYLLWLAYQAAHEPIHEAPAHLRRTDPVDDLSRWFGGCEAVDRCLERLFLARAPGASPPITFLFADNGSPPSVNLVPDGQGKGTTGEGGVNCTLLVHCPGLVVPGVRRDIVSVCDIFATIQDAIGDMAPRPEDSISFWTQLVSGGSSAARRRVVCAEKFQPNGVPINGGTYEARQRMARRDDGWKLRQKLAPRFEESFHFLPTAPPGEDGDEVTPPQVVQDALRAQLQDLSG